MFFVRLVFLLGALSALPGVGRAQATLPAAAAPIAAQTLVPGGAPSQLDLRSHFTLPGVTGTIVQFNTVMGRFNFELFADTPITTANFLGYVNSGGYNNTIIHRAVEGFVIQGGGYTYSTATAHIPVGAPIQNEFRRSNVRGTVAMAKVGGNPDSATSEWFVNLGDNSLNLDSQNGGFTVFARVLGNGMAVVDAIAALPVANINFTATLALENVPVRNLAAGQTQLALENLVAVNSVATVPMYPTTGGTSVLTFSATSSNPAVVAAGINGATLTLTPGAAGMASVTVTATDTHGSTASQIVTVTVAAPSGPRAPVITTQPPSLVRLAAGTSNTVVFTVAATGTPAPSYQWRRNGEALEGQRSPVCVLSGVREAQAGTYTCVVTNSEGTVVSQPAVIAFTAAAPADYGRLANLSIRTKAGTEDQTLIVGFTLGGAASTGTTPLLLRGMGPSLEQFNLTGVLADPVMTMFFGATTLASNDNWGGVATVSERVRQVGAFNFASPASLDAALALAPSRGSYTVQITDRGGRTGIALAEIYDAATRDAASAATPRLVNVSARTEVGTGSDILIAGFVIGGATAKTVLIRAVGPTLAGFGVEGALADPKLQLFSGTTLVAENDNWGGEPGLVAAAQAVAAFPLAGAASNDAVLLVTLPPDGYTAQVSSTTGGTGVALVEIYEIP